jgi:antitoxin (DNA-binding transcriptional repressor) of toxin-antitoxin stability system
MSAALDHEIARMGFRLTWLGGGYGRIDGGVYTIFLVLTDEVSDEERDNFLRLFSHNDCQTAEAFWWWDAWRAEDVTLGSVPKKSHHRTMRAVTIKEAKARLNELIEAALGGEDVVLMRGSKHVVAIVPLTEEDLYVAPRLTDDQAARLWKALAAESNSGKTIELTSMKSAVTVLRKEKKAPGTKGPSVPMR